MAGPEKYGLCTYSVKPNNATCKVDAIDITWDNLPEKVGLCDQVSLQWKGDPEQCRRQFENIFPGFEDVFIGTTGAFSTPLAKLEAVGVHSQLCSRKYIDTNQRMGLNVVAEGGNCFAKPYGSQKWLLSYPPLKDRGLKIEDLFRSHVMGISNFLIADQKIGIGSAGVFRLNDGSVVRGVVIQIGFIPYLSPGRTRGGRFNPVLHRDNVNIYVYTAGVRKLEGMGRIVDLADIKEVEPLPRDEITKIAAKFRKGHMSIREILEELDKADQAAREVDL